VTVWSFPQPASRTPSVMTCAPDSTFSVTLGPMFAPAEIRIADVPRGSVPPNWHLLLPPLTHSVYSVAGLPGPPRAVRRAAPVAAYTAGCKSHAPPQRQIVRREWLSGVIITEYYPVPEHCF
jgi:hypothetical protein